MLILAKLREFLDANKVSYSVHSHPTAKALGLTIPQSVLIRADQVIQ